MYGSSAKFLAKRSMLRVSAAKSTSRSSDARELRRDLGRLVAPRLGHLGLDQLGHAPQQAQVGVDLLAHAGPPDLEHDRRAVLQLRAMHLRDRGRAVRAAVSMSRNTSNGERPSARVSSGSSSSNGTGGTSACSFSNSAIQRGGKRSTRVAITWPSLTKVGPELLERHAHALRGIERDLLGDRGGAGSARRAPARRRCRCAARSRPGRGG